MSARDDRRHLTAGAGAPADPGAASGDPAAMHEIAEAVAAFVDDLVEDGEEALDPGPPGARADPGPRGRRATPAKGEPTGREGAR